MKVSKRKKKNQRQRKIGLEQGALIYYGQKDRSMNIEVISFNDQELIKAHVNTAEEAISYISEDRITWININGLNNIEEIQKIGEFSNLHSLLIEDILDTEHRPKVEVTEDNLFIITRMLYFNRTQELISEHLALLLGANYIISFQESDDEDTFNPIRKRLSSTDTRANINKVSFLLCWLIDSIIDNYLLVVDKTSFIIEELEASITGNPQHNMVATIQQYKKRVLYIQRTILAVRELLSKIESTNPALLDDTKTYFRDFQDHITYCIDTINIYREILWSLTDTYMGAISNKMNNIMKLLTLISTIFIPLTFIAGIYGMNFEHMPELHYRYGYFVVLGVMLLIAISMLYYFRKNKWL